MRPHTNARRGVLGVALLSTTVVSATMAQAPTAAAPAAVPAVGSQAPDFTLPGATRYGRLAEPVRLSDFRGKTVVLAFFPRARTSGCTAQMQAYRDQYESLFNGGKDVVVIGASVDADTSLVAWAREANFPMLFVSDQSGSLGTSYGSFEATRKYDTRNLFVIGPDGRIAHVMVGFKPLSPDAYTELGTAVDKLAKVADADR